LYLSRFPNAPDHEYMEDVCRHLITESAESESIHDYNWTKKHVRVFVQASSGVKGYRPEFDQILKDSFKAWSDAGVISFEFVPDATNADIECVWIDDAKQLASPAEGGEALLRHRGDAVNHARIALLTYRNGPVKTLDSHEVKCLCLHEIGHSLGL